jgi:uncharacterized protein YbjT (DUF2867 family)
MTILITGARGGIGRRLVHRLHAAGHDVRAASRVPEKAELPAGVPAVPLDLVAPATFAAALEGVHDVFLYAEPASIGELVDAAAAADVRRVVLLSSDSVALCDEHNPLARHHLLVEQALRTAPFTATILRPGGFATMALGWAEFIRAGEPVEQAYPEARLDVIHPEDIADIAELALTTGDLDGETISLGGPEVLSFRDQVRTIGELLGREIDVREPTRERAAEQMTSHVPAALVDAVLDYWAQLPGDRDPRSSAAQITGRPGRTFREWATENLVAFQR